MNYAGDLIERMEQEEGQRIDDDDNTIVMARETGTTHYNEHDDVPAGLLIQHRMSPEYEEEQSNCQMLAMLIAGGMSPDDAGKLLGRK